MAGGRRTRGAILGMIWIGFGAGNAGAGEPDLLPVPGAAERRAAAERDADELVRTRFPGVEDLGPAWRRPWEVPGWLPGAVASEAAHRRRTAPSPLWSGFFGLSAEQVSDLVRTSAAEQARRMRAEGTPPPELAAFASEPGLLSLAMLGLKTFTSPTVESPVLFAARRHALALEIARRARAAKSEEESRRVLLGRTESLVESLSADLRGLPLDDAVARFVEEVRTVRRAATTSYVHASEDVLRQAPRDGVVPLYGRLTVDLRILAREAIGTRIEDPSDADLAAAATELERLFESSRRLVAEMGRPEAAAARPIRVRVERVDLGESAWITAIEGVEVLGGEVGAWFARLRNGNAVVDVRGEGSYPPDWFRTELAHVLAAMDERTQVFKAR